MIFSKSIAIDEEELQGVGISAGLSSAMPDAEAQFIEKLKSGDEAAFNNLVNRYGSQVYGLLLRITKDPEEAGDLTQETFIRALKGIAKFRGDAGIKTWLFRIAINQSRNRHRWWKRRKKDQTVSIDAPIRDSQVSIGDSIPDSGINPEENVLRLERQKRLLEAIAELPESYREAVVLCDIEGLTYDEIGGVLEVGLGTVKSRIARGRRELRKKLADF